jgi:uncharacterized protein YwgA
MTSQSSAHELKAFLDAIERQLDWTFDIETFEDRFRLQKYVLLAEDFGFEHGYRYGMHLRGPYSPPLAQDYYTDLTSVAPDTASISEFDADSFAALVRGKDEQWLELAATFREFFRRAPPHRPKQERINIAVDRTVAEKHADRETVQLVVDQLSRADVI